MKRIFYFIDKKGKKEIQFNANDYRMRIHWLHENRYSPWYEIKEEDLLINVTHVYYKSEYEFLIFCYGDYASIKCISLSSEGKKYWYKLPLHMFQLWNGFFVTEDENENYIIRERFIYTFFDKEFQYINSTPAF